MANPFASLLRVLRTIFKKIFNWLKNFIKKYWLFIAALLVVWFAPAIATFLSSAGAPSWLTSAFTWVGANVTPLLSSVWSGITSVGGAAWDAFAASSLGVKAALVSGLAFALAPDETTALVSDTATFVGDVASAALGAVTGAVVSSPIGFALLAGGLLWLLWPTPGKKDEKEFIVAEAEQRGHKTDSATTPIGEVK